MNLIWTPAQLAMLAKVVDLNGFSAAARALAVPKAAVSRAVADLEKTLGVRVLERTTRRIALTSAGRLLYPHARRIGEETDAARAAIAKLREPEARPLRVVADPTYGRVLLSPLVPRFLEAFAHVPLEVALDAEQLTEGAWDVAIRTRPPADGSTRQRLLGAPPALLCATPAYLQRRGQPERPDDLRVQEVFEFVNNDQKDEGCQGFLRRNRDPDADHQGVADQIANHRHQAAEESGPDDHNRLTCIETIHLYQ